MKIDDLTQLGAVIKERRQLAGLTLGQASELLGVGRRFLIELENGSRRANVETVIHVLKMYGLDLHVGLPVALPPPVPQTRQTYKVFSGSIEIGLLGTGSDGLEFSYHEDIINDPAVPPLSLSLPKTAGSFKGTQCSYFENLLPDGCRNEPVTSRYLWPFGGRHGLRRRSFHYFKR